MEQKEFNDLLRVIKEGGFERIAVNIATLWGDKDCDAYFNKLTLDDRGNRQGFPKEVLSAIMKLSVAHHHMFAHPTDDVWTSVPPHKIRADKEWTSNRVVDTQPQRFRISPLTLSILMASAWLLWKVFFNH
jgi:hypothetical protein